MAIARLQWPNLQLFQYYRISLGINSHTTPPRTLVPLMYLTSGFLALQLLSQPLPPAPNLEHWFIIHQPQPTSQQPTITPNHTPHHRPCSCKSSPPRPRSASTFPPATRPLMPSGARQRHSRVPRARIRCSTPRLPSI